MAHINISSARVVYYLRKKGADASKLGRGSVGAQITYGKRYLEIPAIQDVSISLSDGDRVGLIGINGSGKSTLLKLCAGGLSVQSGSIKIEGSVSPQFSLNSGMRPKLTGRQNAELKCLYLRVPQSKIPTLLEDIMELSGLGGYFELPMSTYSAGMRSRLIMAMLKAVRGEILIMDEWINVADPSMNEQIQGIQARLIDKAKILLLASHSEDILKTWVDRVIWLDQGRIKAIGSTDDVFSQYKEFISKKRNK